jgi:hypothetical protein
MEGKKIRWHDGVDALLTLARYRIAPLGSFARRAERAAAATTVSR